MKQSFHLCNKTTKPCFFECVAARCLLCVQCRGNAPSASPVTSFHTGEFGKGKAVLCGRMNMFCCVISWHLLFRLLRKCREVVGKFTYSPLWMELEASMTSHGDSHIYFVWSWRKVLSKYRCIYYLLVRSCAFPQYLSVTAILCHLLEDGKDENLRECWGSTNCDCLFRA